jgi:hypothetical protein
MSTHYDIPLKIHVTGVTRVTNLAKRPFSLAFAPVTRLRNHPYTTCYAALMCNASIAPRSLQAAVRRVWSSSDSRWFRLRHRGRGIERYTTPETLGHG